MLLLRYFCKFQFLLLALRGIACSHYTKGTDLMKLSSRNYNKDKIRVLLISDVLKFCRKPEILNAIEQEGASQSLGTLRDIITNSEVEGQDAKLPLYSAITLAIFDDLSGYNILMNSKKYWATNSLIEELHVTAALILLGRTTNISSSSTVNWTPLSPGLTKEILGH